jgi:putative aldouronate transport system permease protein
MKFLTRSDRAFVIFSYISLVLYTLVVLLPIWNLFAVSISGANPVNAGNIRLWPQEFQWSSFAYVLDASQFYISLRTSVIMTVLGSVLGILLCVMAAYPLSKPELPGRKKIIIIYVFTMMFSGGIVPQYILMNSLGLLNSIWSVILPIVTNVFNLLLVKNFFENLPEEIEESAKIDGATHLQTLFQIVIPISKPVIATIMLFYAVELWNEYFHARMYITDQSALPLQVYLRTVIFEAKDPSGSFTLDSGTSLHLAPQSIINATILLSMVPMMVLYTFLQKYFVQGIVIGSVKG